MFVFLPYREREVRTRDAAATWAPVTLPARVLTRPAVPHDGQTHGSWKQPDAVRYGGAHVAPRS